MQMRIKVCVVAFLFCFSFLIAAETQSFSSFVFNGKDKDVKRLLHDGVSASTITSNGIPVVVLAAARGHLSIVRMLLDDGASVLLVTKTGDSALMCAAAKGHDKVVLELIKRKANIDHENRHMHTALCMAVSGGHLRIVKILLEAGAKFDENLKHSPPILFHAVLNGHMDIAKLLVAYGANIDAPIDDGKTLLFVAAMSDNAKLMDLLIDLGASKDSSDNKGYTALMYAVEMKHTKVAQKLIKSAADLDVQSLKWKRTALLLALENKDYVISKMLVDAGAGLDYRDKLGGTALSIATAIGDARIIKLIEVAGASSSLFVSQPTMADAALTLSELKSLSGTIMLKGLAWSKSEKDTKSWIDIESGFKKGSGLRARGGRDVLGNSYILKPLSAGPKLSPESVKVFEPVLIKNNSTSKKFWGQFIAE